MPFHRISHRLAPLLCLALLVLHACSKRPAVDERITGQWHASLGQWVMTFEAGADGPYRTTFTGPGAPPAETGEMEASDGQWRVRKANGEQDSGTYYFVSEDTLVMQGGRGALTWRRARAAPPPPMTAVSPVAPSSQQPGRSEPLRGDWPLAKVPDIARDAAGQARVWHPDAILTGIDAELLQSNSRVVHDIETPAGRVTLSLSFCSPGQGRSVVVRPVAAGGAPLPENPADCRAEQAIGEDFMDLPEAVGIARDRGMKAELPRRASLRNRTSGVRGEDVFGVTWQIFSTDRSDRSYLIPTEPQTAETVRAVDPCRLVTATEAQSVLGGEVRTVPPHARENRTWSCIYQAGDDQRRRLSLKVDENPAVNARGFMANQRRKGRKSVPELGDEAYVFDSPAGFATLDVRLGDTLLKFGLGGPSSGREQTLTDVARRAVSRMVAGEGILAEVSPEAKLTGEWTVRTGGGTLLLVVRKDKSLTLGAAEPRISVLTTRGDQWEMLDRARRSLGSGNWEWLGPGEFRTDGDLPATWRRVPGDRAPGRIARPLIEGTGIEADDAGPTGPWPQMPRDERLTGLWEAQTRIDGRSVDLAWRIRADGPSTLLRAETGKGFVENVDRWQRVILKFPEEIEDIGRRMKLDLHDGAVVTGFPDDDHMDMQLHNLKRLQWTRVGADPEDMATGGRRPGAGDDSVPVQTVDTPPAATADPEPETPVGEAKESGADQPPPPAEISATDAPQTDHPAGEGEESARDKAARVGRKTADIVEGAAETVGGFIEGIFGDRSSSEEPGEDSRPAESGFGPTDW